MEMVPHLIVKQINSISNIFARKFANEFAFHSLIHIFEEEIAEKIKQV